MKKRFTFGGWSAGWHIDASDPVADIGSYELTAGKQPVNVHGNRYVVACLAWARMN